LKNFILIERARRLVLGFAPAALLSVLSTPLAAQHLYECRGYPSRGVVRDIALRVETMRRLERETADRLVGLDTRPYAWLLEQARKAESEIAVPALLEAEKTLERCRNNIRPLRAACAGAASALVRVIEEILSAEAKPDKKPDVKKDVSQGDKQDDTKDDTKDDKKNAGSEARKAFAQVMPVCERAVSLAPLDSSLRQFE
jgi:hypothetical protein